jgi:preprotein translocase SecE subunit
MPTTPTQNSTPSQSQAVSSKSTGGNPITSDEVGQNWFKGIALEWGKITWPTKVQLFTNTLVVLLMTGAMTVFVWLIDTSFRWGIHLIAPSKMGT